MMVLTAVTRTAAAFATRQVITSGFVHALRATTARAAVCSLTQGTSALPSRQHRLLIRLRIRRPILHRARQHTRRRARRPTQRLSPPRILRPLLLPTPPLIPAMMAVMDAIRTAAAFATKLVGTTGFVCVRRATTALAAACSLTQGTSAWRLLAHRLVIRLRVQRLIHRLPRRLPRRHHPLLLQKSSS